MQPVYKGKSHSCHVRRQWNGLELPIHLRQRIIATWSTYGVSQGNLSLWYSARSFLFKNELARLFKESLTFIVGKKYDYYNTIDSLLL